VVTNIDREHLDHFGSEQALFAAFLDFAEKVPFYGLVVIGADNPAAARLAPLVSKRHTTYGLVAGDWRGEIVDAGPNGTRFRVRVRGRAHGEVRVRMPGVHYAGNALAALCVSDFLGVPFTTAGEALAGFEGVDRRFTIRGEVAEVLVVDDYGHHPTELAATIAAARLWPAPGSPSSPTATRDPGPAARVRARAGGGRRAAADRRVRRHEALTWCRRAALLATFPDGMARHVSRDRLTAALAEAAVPAIWCCAWARATSRAWTEPITLLEEKACGSAPPRSIEDAPRRWSHRRRPAVDGRLRLARPVWGLAGAGAAPAEVRTARWTAMQAAGGQGAGGDRDGRAVVLARHWSAT
jgi:hypothetical protein